MVFNSSKTINFINIVYLNKLTFVCVKAFLVIPNNIFRKGS